MKINLPKTNTSKKQWTLRVVRKNPILDGEEKWGVCDCGKREIVISKEVQKEGVAREVFLHEMLHRLMWFLSEDAVDHLAKELDHALDAAEASNILEL